MSEGTTKHRLHPNQIMLALSLEPPVSRAALRRERWLRFGIASCALLLAATLAFAFLGGGEPMPLPAERPEAPPPIPGQTLEYRSDSVIIQFNAVPEEEPTEEQDKPAEDKPK